jgi:hypothetical protein
MPIVANLRISVSPSSWRMLGITVTNWRFKLLHDQPVTAIPSKDNLTFEALNLYKYLAFGLLSKHVNK